MKGSCETNHFVGATWQFVGWTAPNKALKALGTNPPASVQMEYQQEYWEKLARNCEMFQGWSINRKGHEKTRHRGDSESNASVKEETCWFFNLLLMEAILHQLIGKLFLSFVALYTFSGGSPDFSHQEYNSTMLDGCRMPFWVCLKTRGPQESSQQR